MTIDQWASNNRGQLIDSMKTPPLAPGRASSAGNLDAAASSLLEISHAAYEEPSSVSLPSGTGSVSYELAAYEESYYGQQQGPREPTQVERDLCSDFVCCGNTLPDLHALLQHYEEMHVRIEDEVTMGGVSTTSLGLSGTPSGSSCSGATSAPCELQMEEDRLSAFDTTIYRTVTPASQAATYSGVPSYYGTNGAPYYANGSYPSVTSPHHQASMMSYNPYATSYYPYQSGYQLGPYATTPYPPAVPGASTAYYHHPSNPSSYGLHGHSHGPSSTVLPPGGLISRRPKSTPVNLAADPSAMNTLRAMLPPVLADFSEDGCSLRLIQTALSSTLSPSTNASTTAAGGGGREEAANGATASVLSGSSAAAASSSSSLSGSSALSPASAKKRPYVCRVEGCGKTYKNPNGLKYHMLHGHAREGKDSGEKPHRCPYANCPKRYKNANGLKYHVQHGHTGQTPPMRRTISSLKSISGGLSQIEAALKREQAIRAQMAAAAATVGKSGGTVERPA